MKKYRVLVRSLGFITFLNDDRVYDFLMTMTVLRDGADGADYIVEMQMQQVRWLNLH
ncbi:hypothetical protein [Pseudomonas sp. 39167]|uniref:hypothetical protein n=1 Tax=Pseudomonas sp. 39167 TaxID=2967215 RepID=UPI0023641A7A|nr:hypothetical protein [Pseudomonas sp. 39167]MDD2030074.1 hypothetical protein [Pseudomonas sp. 39167]